MLFTHKQCRCLPKHRRLFTTWILNIYVTVQKHLISSLRRTQPAPNKRRLSQAALPACRCRCPSAAAGTRTLLQPAFLPFKGTGRNAVQLRLYANVAGLGPRRPPGPLPRADGSAASPGAGARGPPAGGGRGGGERRARAPTRCAALRHPPLPSPPAAGMWTALARPWGGCAAAALYSLGLPCPPPRDRRRAGTGPRRPGGRLGRQRWERRCRRGAPGLRGGQRARAAAPRPAWGRRLRGVRSAKLGAGGLRERACALLPPRESEVPSRSWRSPNPAPLARLRLICLFSSALGSFFFFPFNFSGSLLGPPWLRLGTNIRVLRRSAARGCRSPRRHGALCCPAPGCRTVAPAVLAEPRAGWFGSALLSCAVSQPEGVRGVQPELGEGTGGTVGGFGAPPKPTMRWPACVHSSFCVKD